ncbi:hypothetical protein GHT09_002389 [Marmota monax]|uniref:Uncharacterized protein n=1 Tax=Marmota monax TaxID=9995 RepID=A0A834V8A6_MARMO|nr:hypothetical protein GHT09_002389 [Marmota monax]
MALTSTQPGLCLLGLPEDTCISPQNSLCQDPGPSHWAPSRRRKLADGNAVPLAYCLLLSLQHRLLISSTESILYLSEKLEAKGQDVTAAAILSCVLL